MEIEEKEALKAQKEKKARIAALIIAVVCVAVTAAIIVMLFVYETPLRDLAIGKWRAAVDGNRFISSTVEKLYAQLGITDDDPTVVTIEIGEYVDLEKDGTFTVTVSRDDVISALNTVVDKVMLYYAEKPENFLKNFDLTPAYLAENGVMSDNLESFFDTIFSGVRENINKIADNFLTDYRGDLIVAGGTYKAGSSRIDFTVDPEKSIAGLYSGNDYMSVSVKGSSMTVNEISFSALGVESGDILTKVK